MSAFHRLFLTLLLSFMSVSFAYAAQCPGAHCSAIDVQVNNICKSDGFSGNVVYVQGPNGFCYCNCSCLANGTLVYSSDGTFTPIEKLAVGESVMALQKDGSWKKTIVKFSGGTEGDGNPVPYAVFVGLDNGNQLIVTADHPFLLSNKTLKTASRLTLQDKLLDKDLKPINISSIAFGTYTGGIHNISTSVSNNGETLFDNHLILTGGVISGDYYAQLFLVGKASLAAPTIGSQEYRLKHGEPSLQHQEIKTLSIGNEAVSPQKFKAYKPFVVPDGAVPFFPEGTIAKPGMLKSLSDPVPLEIAEYLVHNFKRHYSDVTYHIEWGDDTVNAYAWLQGGQKHVAILGGLIRHNAMGVEGIGLVLAHELGHHFGGTPTYPNSPLSCEGQSDYWAALIGMREVWWGPEYIRQMEQAIIQLDNLFVGVIFPSTEGSNFLPKSEKYGATPLQCSHPPKSCRKATYNAGLRAEPKPICAGIEPNGGLLTQ